MISEGHRQVIKNQYKEYKSYRKVAQLNGVSDKTVRTIVLDLYIKDKKQTGPKPKIDKRAETKIKKLINQRYSEKKKTNARLVQHECGLNNVSLKTVQRKLNGLNMDFKQTRNQIVLTKAHCKARLQFAEFTLSNIIDWSRVVWTDEKRFSGDGPDNQSSWTPQGKQLVHNRRQQGGSSIQVYGALLPGPFLLVFEVCQRNNSELFMDFFESKVLPQIRTLLPENFYLQQDNATIHVSSFSKLRFAELGVELLEWPARSPDLNIIENCWSLMTQLVYKDGPIATKDQLWKKIDEAVAELNTNSRHKLVSLFSSIQRRLLDVIKLKGKLTKY